METDILFVIIDMTFKVVTAHYYTGCFIILIERIHVEFVLFVLLHDMFFSVYLLLMCSIYIHSAIKPADLAFTTLAKNHSIQFFKDIRLIINQTAQKSPQNYISIIKLYIYIYTSHSFITRTTDQYKNRSSNNGTKVSPNC